MEPIDISFACTHDCGKQEANALIQRGFCTNSNFNIWTNILFWYLQAGSDEVQSIGSNSSRVFLFEYSVAGNGKWTKTESVNVNDPVHDISFAPNVGRSFHILGIASKDLHIYSICPARWAASELLPKPIEVPSGLTYFFSRVFSEATGTSRLDVHLMAKFTDHSCTVWRVSWNLTGTILSSSGDDGCVRMWKSKKKIYFFS